jgi:two-component system, NarL family, nitrate/nitrite response regulator NarL
MLSAIGEAMASKPVVTTTAPASSLITVVIAAPELSKRKGLARCFSEKAGFALVRCTNSLDDIMSRCGRLSPCVLIIGQEPMEGAGLAEFIRKVKFGRGVHILVVGPQEIQGTVTSILRAGCLGFLESGCSNYILRRAVRSIAAGELWASRRAISRLIQDFLLIESLQGLSPRENEILSLIGQGYKNREIAERLFISIETVHWHVRGLYAKIGVKDRLSAAVYAGEHIGPSPRMPGVRQTAETLVAAG